MSRPGFRLRTLVMTAALAASAGEALARAAPPGTNRRCGEYCLRVGLAALDFEPGAVAAAVDRLGPAPAAGHALADLSAAVDAAGGYALAVDTSPDALCRRQAVDQFACVGWFDGNHFALISEVAPDGAAVIVDPPSAYSLPPETLAARWDGVALLVSADPLTPEGDLPTPFPWLTVILGAAGGPLLAAAAVTVRTSRLRRVTALAALAIASGAGCWPDDTTRLGAAAGRPPRAVFDRVEATAVDIPAGAPHVFQFQLTNRGGSDLHLSGVDSSCGCTAASASAEVLPPGASATVSAEIRPRHAEKRRAKLLVRTDDPDVRSSVLRIAWEAVAPLSPDSPELDFGELRPWETAERTVRLVRHLSAGESAGRPVAADTSGPATMEARLDGDRIFVTVTAPAEPGAGVGRVTVRLVGGRADALTVPVAWRVRGVLDADPPRLFLGGGAPGTDCGGRVIVTMRAGVEFTDAELRPGSGRTAGWEQSLAIDARRIADRRFLLEMAGPLPADAGRRTCVLLVRGRDGSGTPHELLIPVSSTVWAAGVASPAASDDS